MVCVSRGAVMRMLSLLVPGSTTQTLVSATAPAPMGALKLAFWLGILRTSSLLANQPAAPIASSEPGVLCGYNPCISSARREARLESKKVGPVAGSTVDAGDDTDRNTPAAMKTTSPAQRA